MNFKYFKKILGQNHYGPKIVNYFLTLSHLIFLNKPLQARIRYRELGLCIRNQQEVTDKSFSVLNKIKRIT